MDHEEKRAELKAQIDDALKKIEKRRAEMSVVVQAVRADPERSLNYDPEAIEKNMELSEAIQIYTKLKKRFDEQID